MAIVVETGAGLTNANSYVSEATVIAYASDRGVTLPETDLLRSQVVNAGDYLNNQEREYLGERRTREQRMAWPRIGAEIDSWIVDSDEIPLPLIECQCELVMDLHAGIDIYERDYRQPIKIGNAGGASVTFATMDENAREVRSQAMALLKRLTRPYGLRNQPSFADDAFLGRAY